MPMDFRLQYYLVKLVVTVTLELNLSKQITLFLNYELNSTKVVFSFTVPLNGMIKSHYFLSRYEIRWWARATGVA
jgi:hypothetical protein